MHAFADPVGGIEITEGRCSYGATTDRGPQGGPLHDRHRLTDVEAELGVQGQRAAVKRRLEQAHGWDLALAAAIQYCLHQASSDAMILAAGFHCNRPYAENGGAFIQAIAADDSAVQLRYDAPEAGVREHRREQAARNPGIRDVGRESMVCVDLVKGLVTNAPARGSVLWTCFPNRHIFLRLARLA